MTVATFCTRVFMGQLVQKHSSLRDMEPKRLCFWRLYSRLNLHKLVLNCYFSIYCHIIFEPTYLSMESVELMAIRTNWYL